MLSRCVHTSFAHVRNTCSDFSLNGLKYANCSVPWQASLWNTVAVPSLWSPGMRWIAFYLGLVKPSACTETYNSEHEVPGRNLRYVTDRSTCLTWTSFQAYLQKVKRLRQACHDRRRRLLDFRKSVLLKCTQFSLKSCNSHKQLRICYNLAIRGLSKALYCTVNTGYHSQPHRTIYTSNCTTYLTHSTSVTFTSTSPRTSKGTIKVKVKFTLEQRGE